MKIEFVYFDFADTLVHKAGLVPALIEIFSQEGRTLTAREVRLEHSRARAKLPSPAEPERSYYERLNAELALAVGVEANSDLLEKMFNRLRACSWEPFSDIAALDSLPVAAGIASNWKRGLLQDVDKLLSRPFQVVIGSGDEGVAKPNQEFFQRAIAKSGIRAENTLFVGDSPSLDCTPAQEAGMRAVLVDRFDLYSTDCGCERITSLEELHRIWR